MLEEYEDLLSVDEACEALRMGHNAVYTLLNTGELKAFRNGRYWRIPQMAVEQYIMRQAGLRMQVRL